VLNNWLSGYASCAVFINTRLAKKQYAFFAHCFSGVVADFATTAFKRQAARRYIT